MFVRRRPELLTLEGWYGTWKLSCRFRDILRCGEFNGKTEHFTSCFRKGHLYEEQPYLRCLNPNWAIIYTPDKHGNFMGRAFVHMEEDNEGKWLVVDKIYGNRLIFDDIKDKLMIIRNQRSRASGSDTYLGRKVA